MLPTMLKPREILSYSTVSFIWSPATITCWTESENDEGSLQMLANVT